MFEKHNISLQLNKRNKKTFNEKNFKKNKKSFGYVKNANYICNVREKQKETILLTILKKKGKNYEKEEL